jgi:hypothetical protein
MSNSGFVLVLITSDACGHCRTFKSNQLDTLRKRLYTEFKNVSLELINLPSFSSPVPHQYPQSLKDIIGWFPMFILFPSDEWKSGTLSNYIVFNGIVKNKSKPQYVSKYALNVDHIFEWMENGN